MQALRPARVRSGSSTSGYGSMMFRHVVLFRWDPVSSEAAKDAVASALGELPGAIPTIRAYHFGADVGINSGNFDYAVVADFDDEAGYVAYRDHPAHRAVIADRIAPIVAERAAVQYDTGD
jgi:hypothetical protein